MDLESLTLLFWISAGAIVLLAGLVHGVFGLGFPLLATPFLAILIDIRSAVLITLLPTMTVNIVSILRGGRWSESIGRYWPLVVMIPIGTLAGTWLLVSVDPGPFRLLLAAIIVLHLAGERLRFVHVRWVRESPWLAYLVFGLAAGFTAGTVNVMVPLLVIFALEVGMTPLVMVQVFNLCFLVGKSVQVGAFAQVGLLTGPLALATIPLAAVAAAALLLGMHLRDRVEGEACQGWLRKVLAGMAVVLTVQFIAGVWPGRT
ncbi:MAG: sulfite exporter TauE/SafE family protein [Pseudomonadota bacterium]|nr:sulfite exporter TauE/SafE family protein [Pseudomonadota bacterium]